MNILALILLYGLWASIFPCNKLLLTFSSPLFLTGSRMAIAGIFLLGYLSIWKRNSLCITKKKFIAICLLAFLGIYITNILEAWGLQYLPAANACFIYSLSPFLTAICSYVYYKEKITFKKALGLVIGFLGFFPVLFIQNNGGKNEFGQFNLFALPELSIIGATLCSVFSCILLKSIVRDGNTSPLLANGTSMLIGGIFALIHSSIFDNWNPIPVTAGKISAFIPGVFGVIIVSNIICYNLYGHMLKNLTATFISFAGLLSPIFSSIISWMILDEDLNPILFISTLVIAFGLWIVYREEFQLGYIVRQKPSIEEKTV